MHDLSAPVSPFACPLAPFSSLSLVLGLFSSVSKSGVAAPDAMAACRCHGWHEYLLLHVECLSGELNGLTSLTKYDAYMQ